MPWRHCAVPGRRLAGLTSETFGTRLTSDLRPGFDFSLDYSLFQGSTLSDTAKFDPYLTRITSSFRISQRENPLVRWWFAAVPAERPAVEVVARGLDNPRGLAFGSRGELYVAEAGRGGPCHAGAAGGTTSPTDTRCVAQGETPP
mgnify:CR=1 FL=1